MCYISKCRLVRLVRHYVTVAVLGTAYFFAFTETAAAYIDPGFAALALQGFLAVVVTMGVYWRRTKEFVLRLFGRRTVSGSKDDDPDGRKA